MTARDIECVRCGETFDTLTARIMHVERKRCPEIETDEEVDAADYMHALDEIGRYLDDGGGGVKGG